LWILPFLQKNGVKKRPEFWLGKSVFDRVFLRFYHEEAVFRFCLHEGKSERGKNFSFDKGYVLVKQLERVAQGLCGEPLQRVADRVQALASPSSHSFLFNFFKVSFMYQVQDFKHLLGLAGMSDALLTNHFTLYEGYVNNTNKLLEKLAGLAAADQAATPEYAELKRRFGWEFNGMRLHEYYFGNMTKNTAALDEKSALYKKIVEDFGSFEAWEKDFRSTGAMRGIGWVILYFDAEGNRLLNTWINEHDLGHVSGATPLLIMDVFEHAFMLDYGLKRADYIEAFFKAIAWERVLERFESGLKLRGVIGA
jgi:Fe-Mn family superoxide dismutase